MIGQQKRNIFHNNKQTKVDMKNNNQQQEFYTFKWENYQPLPISSNYPNYNPHQNNYSINNMISPPHIYSNTIYESSFKNEKNIPQNYSQEKSYQHYEDQSNLSHQLNSQEQPKFTGQSQSHPESIKLNIRSQLIRRTRKYQISTNNAHKKYINCLKNLFYEALSQLQIQQFQQRYIKLKSNRVFFFIILVYIKYRFSQQLGQAVKQGFYIQMNQKIKEYEEQIRKCNDFMLKNYRFQEIHQIEIALKAIDEFYLGNTPLAVQYLYRKDKHIIVKQNHFRASLKLIQDLQKQFSSIEAPKITQPYLKDHYHRKLANRVEQKPKQTTHDISLNEPINTKINQIQQDPIKQKQITQNIDSIVTKNMQKVPQQNNEEQMDSIQQQISESQQINDEEQQSQNFSSKSNQNQQNINYQFQNQKEHYKNPIEDVIFPPIPPYFYLPNFDQKYGNLFRRLVYIKSWRQFNQRFQNQDYLLNNRSMNKRNQPIPSSLVFGPQSSLFKRKN